MSFKITDLYIKSFDDINLHYRKDLVDNPKAIILISHGLAEHCGRYNYTTKKLNSFGYSVYRYDHRGHGLSDGRRGYIKKADNLFEDANTLIDLIKLENPDIPIFIIGHNMGGHVLSGFGSKYKNKVNGMIFCGALICDAYGLTNLEYNNDDPFTLIPEDVSHDLTHDIDVLDSYGNDDLILSNITLSMYNALNESSNNMINTLSNFSYPCLILHGSSDTIVSQEDSKFLYGNISSNDKEIRILNGLYHRLLDEIVKDEILDEISKWINSRI